MKHVTKQPSPADFEAWKAYRSRIRKGELIRWGELKGNRAQGPLPEGAVDYSKAEIRTVLFNEQRGLCCYCNDQLIDNASNTAIDHVSPKEGTANQHLIFDYNNLSLSCKGNEKTPKPRELHCDAEKHDKVLPLTQFDLNCETDIVFAIDGGINGTTDAANTTIDYLNLSIEKLERLRADAIAGFVYEDEEKTMLISREEAKAVLQGLNAEVESAPLLRPFIVAITQSLAGIV